MTLCLPNLSSSSSSSSVGAAKKHSHIHAASSITRTAQSPMECRVGTHVKWVEALPIFLAVQKYYTVQAKTGPINEMELQARVDDMSAARYQIFANVLVWVRLQLRYLNLATLLLINMCLSLWQRVTCLVNYTRINFFFNKQDTLHSNMFGFSLS